MKRNIFRKTVSCLASVAMATMMVPAIGGGVALADVADDGGFISAPTGTYENSSQTWSSNVSNLITTYGVRAGSAGADYLGISNTNFDFTAGNANLNTQYTDWQGNTYTLPASSGNALGIWGSAANEKANPYIWNLFYNVGQRAATSTTAATTWMKNTGNYSSWGDSLTYTTGTGADAVTTATGSGVGVDVVFGANKRTNWNNFSAANTYMKAADDASSSWNPTYANNDATNIWTQIYTEGQLASAVDAGKTTSSSNLYHKTTRYDVDSSNAYGSATKSAISYEKAIRGNLLYVAAMIDQQEATKKTVAYLYAIDSNKTGYFFIPTATGNSSADQGLVEGDDTGAGADTAATADDNYAANNGTIDFGYMDTLPYVTTTFTGGQQFTDQATNKNGIIMKVEDIYKVNPATKVTQGYDENGEETTDSVLSGVDVIIYNSTVLENLSGDKGGRNSSSVNNDYLASSRDDRALTPAEVNTWASRHGFSKGATACIAGDDFGTGTNQDTTIATAPRLYCERNYTMDKNARAAWAFSKVYPELYKTNSTTQSNCDASYGYWVNKVYHIKCLSSGSYVDDVIAAMTGEETAGITYSSRTTSAMENYFKAGYAWWHYVGQYDSDWNGLAYYNGSSRASYIDGSSASEETDSSIEGASNKIGIFTPSSLWTYTESEMSAGLTYVGITIAGVNNSKKAGSFSALSLSPRWSAGDVYFDSRVDSNGDPWEDEYFSNGCYSWRLVYAEDGYASDYSDEYPNMILKIYKATEDSGVIPNNTAYDKNTPVELSGVMPWYFSVDDWIAVYNFERAFPKGSPQTISSIVKVEIGDGITAIGDNFMYDPDGKFPVNSASDVMEAKSSIQEISIASSVTSIGKNAFNGIGHVYKDTVLQEQGSKVKITFGNDASEYSTGGSKIATIDAGAFCTDAAATFDEIYIPQTATVDTTAFNRLAGDASEGLPSYVHLVKDWTTDDFVQAIEDAQENADAAAQGQIDLAKAACEAAGVTYDETKSAAENMNAAKDKIAQTKTDLETANAAAATQKAAKEALEKSVRNACETAGITYDEAKTVDENLAAAQAAAQAAGKASVVVPAVAQKIFVKVAAKTYKAKNLKKKAASFFIGAQAMTKLTYKVTKKASAKISVSKYGKVTLKKGAKKGLYKVTVTAAGTKTYKKATRVITIRVK